jgi:hypothetical protein
MEEIENICRGILHKSTAREFSVSQTAPEMPSADYLTGLAAGRLDGQATVAALVISMVTGESATQILEDARAQAAVENAFPFDLHIEPSEPS